MRNSSNLPLLLELPDRLSVPDRSPAAESGERYEGVTSALYVGRRARRGATVNGHATQNQSGSAMEKAESMRILQSVRIPKRAIGHDDPPSRFGQFWCGVKIPFLKHGHTTVIDWAGGMRLVCTECNHTTEGWDIKNEENS